MNMAGGESPCRVELTALLATHFVETLMFDFLFTRIHQWFERAVQRSDEEYLAGARDLAELERRIRSVERR
jgi:hypothetical protein